MIKFVYIKTFCATFQFSLISHLVNFGYICFFPYRITIVIYDISKIEQRGKYDVGRTGSRDN